MSEVSIPEQQQMGEVESPAEATPAGPSPEEWQAAQEELAYVREYLAQQQQAQPEPQGEAEPDYGELDLFDPQQLAAFIQQQVQQSIAPISDWTQQQQMAEAEERALDILDDISSRDGEFMDKEHAYETARALANVYFVEEAQRYGNGPKAAESALQRAAAAVREYENAIGQAAVERHMNQLTNLSGAARDMPVNGAGAQALVTEPGGDELSLVRKYGGFPGTHP